VSKDPHRQQKRQAKLAKRARKERTRKRQSAEPLPYSGRKYQSDRWAPHVYQTECAIYEVVMLSDRRLTNDQTKEALVHLINQLRSGVSPTLAEGDPEVPFAPGQEIDFLVQNIRHHWRKLFNDEGPVSTSDLVGILRTLLYSIEAHAWHTGRSRGYVDFLVSFMRK
jgi:hypothetical protein